MDMRKEFVKYTSFNIMGMLGLSCYILADTFFVAKGLGSQGLAALNLAIPVYSLIHGTGLMLAMGGATRFSICKGQNTSKTGEQVFSQTLLLTGVAALLFVLAGAALSGQIACLLGANGAVDEMTRTYLKVLLLFAPAFLANDLLICFVRNDGAPQLAMAAMLGGSFSNILLDYIFIFPCRMGIFGAVFATGLAPLISMGILSVFFFGRKNTFHLIKTDVSLQRALQLLAGGVPSLVTELSSGIVIIIFNMRMLSLMGTIGVAAYGVIANLSLVVLSIFTGIAQGIQPLISRYYGAGKIKTTRRIYCYAGIMAAILSGLIYIGILIGADPIVAVFNSEGNKELQEVAMEGAKLYFTAIAFAGFNIVTAIYFTSSDQPRQGNIISLLRGFVLMIPLVFLMSEIFGIQGLWLTFPLTEILTAFVAGSFYVNYRIKGAGRV